MALRMGANVKVLFALRRILVKLWMFSSVDDSRKVELWRNDVFVMINVVDMMSCATHGPVLVCIGRAKLCSRDGRRLTVDDH